MTEPDSPSSQDYQALRELLLAKEQQRLDELEARLSDFINDQAGRKEEIATLMPLILQRARELDPHFDSNLKTSFENNFKSLVQDEPEQMAEELYPVIGPSLRKSVAVTLNSFVENINQTLDHSLSPKSFKWRVEAARTGRPFSEIVFKHTIRYRVEQLFLIHSDTGLLIDKAINTDVEAQDSDAVSAMLTAIQDFVRDSFGGGTETLDKVDIGEHTVWLVRGPRAMLAAVVRGSAPREFHNELVGTLERVHLQYGPALANYSGNPDDFTGLEKLLAYNLQEESVDPADTNNPDAEEKPSKAPIILGAIATISLLFLGWWIYSSITENREKREIDTFVNELQAAPGIAVLNVNQRDDQWFISGLLDPLAVNPADYLSQRALDADKVNLAFSPYQSLHPDFVISHARQALRTPDTVDMRIQNGVLIATGSASAEWITRANQQAFLPAGIEAFDTSGVHVDERARVDRLVSQIRNAQIEFRRDTQFSPNGRKAMEDMANIINEIIKLDEILDLNLAITIVGHSDGVGSEHDNIKLRLERSSKVQEGLIRRGVPARYLRALALRAFTPESTPDPTQRRASFRVKLKEK